MDLAARDMLIENHLDLVPPIARRVQQRLPPSFDLDDLIGEGYIGLMHAAERYRPKTHGGTPFSAYARPRIHGAIVDSVRRRAWIENTALPFEDAPEQVTMPELPYLVTGSVEVGRRRRYSRAAYGRPGAEFRHTHLPKPLTRALQGLTARQRAILRAFYGEERSVAEIAELLSLTIARVTAEHAAALAILHRAMLSNLSILGSAYYFASHVSVERAA